MFIEILPGQYELPVPLYNYWNIGNVTCVFARVDITKNQFTAGCGSRVTEESASHERSVYFSINIRYSRRNELLSTLNRSFLLPIVFLRHFD